MADEDNLHLGHVMVQLEHLSNAVVEKERLRLQLVADKGRQLLIVVHGEIVEVGRLTVVCHHQRH